MSEKRAYTKKVKPEETTQQAADLNDDALPTKSMSVDLVLRCHCSRGKLIQNKTNQSSLSDLYLNRETRS